MKKSLKNLKESLGDSKLALAVLTDALEEAESYSDETIEKCLYHYVSQVLEHGCVSGMVGSLIYYTDTTKFYQKHKDEINEMLKNDLWNLGESSPQSLFGDRWDAEDPLALDDLNQNLLAWYGYEEVCRQIQEYLEDKIENH